MTASNITTKKTIIDQGQDAMNTAWKNADGTITIETFYRHFPKAIQTMTPAKFNDWREKIRITK